MEKLRFVFRALAFAFTMGMASAESLTVYPVRSGEFAQSLNGGWSFKYIAGHDAGADGSFHEPGFDVSSWKKMPVPANWELHGFAEPKYALELEDGLGLYRRSFHVPAAWAGRRVCLRFDGVAFGFEAWVNGRKIGESSASAYNPNTFDITGTLQSEGDNVLAVRVTTKPPGYEFDVNDDWSLSGIFRDVTIFSVPQTHFADLTTSTKLADDGAAKLSVAVSISGSDGEVSGKLLAPDGKVVWEFPKAHTSHGSYTTHFSVKNPQLWTAETPVLYQLQLTLTADGKPLQSIEERIGLRETSIADGALRLNGRPIKLHGVNHHDLDPENGRAITEAQMRRDLGLMKKGNINFIRTSHYPPQPRFIELCDELGFYVMCEVPIGKGEEHLGNPACHDNILARVEPTITRDKNRPSVIVWSIGNENPINDAELEACRRAKELDPTRPVCLPKIGSYFADNYAKIPDYVDIYSPHYPGNTALRRLARSLKRPVILTEYAHALGLATDRIQDQWEIIQGTPVLAGGSIWHFQDQGILRTSDKALDLKKDTDLVWLDARRNYDTHGNDGCDGIVYSDRTPQTDFWETRKVYSPVQIAEQAVKVEPGKREVSLTIENRHDFRSLAGMKLEWSLQRNGSGLLKGSVALNAPAREKETVCIPVDMPSDAAGDVLTLELRCINETGMQLTERTVRLNLSESRDGSWLADLPAAGKPKVIEDGREVRIEHADWILTFSRTDGSLTLKDRAGRELLAGIQPHPGRKLTMTEGRSAGKNNTWRFSTLTQVTDLKTTVEWNADTVCLAVSGSYPRPQTKKEKEGKLSDEPLDQEDKPVWHEVAKDEAFIGGYRAEIQPSGVISIHYDYVPTNAKGKFSEAGLSLVLPSGMIEFRWIGQGPYAGYPGKDRLNEFGIFHMNRGDLRFQGNRRGTETALLTTPSGVGVALMSNPADVAVERDGDKTLLSHNAVISGLGNKGTSPETSIAADKAPHVMGSFTLVPLTGKWPAALTRIFGKPTVASDVYKPFYHSYDQ